MLVIPLLWGSLPHLKPTASATATPPKPPSLGKVQTVSSTWNRVIFVSVHLIVMW